MKPTKNRTYCNACKRSKMLFETEAKADNFIRFNKEDFEKERRRVPARSYYCALCGGWHITSNDSEEHGAYMDNLDQELLEKLVHFREMKEASKERARQRRREIQKQKMWDMLDLPKGDADSLPKVIEVNNNGVPIPELSKDWSIRLSKINICLILGQVEEAARRILELEQDFQEDTTPLNLAVLKKGRKIDALEKLKRWHKDLEHMLNLEEDMKQEALQGITDHSYYQDVARTLDNLSNLAQAQAVISTIELKLEKEDITGIDEEISKCESALKGIRGAGRKILSRNANMRLNEFKQKICSLGRKIPEYKLRNRAPQIAIQDMKSVLIQLIELCQQAESALENNQFHKCEELLQKASEIYKALPVLNEDTSIIKSAIDALKRKLESTCQDSHNAEDFS